MFRRLTVRIVLLVTGSLWLATLLIGTFAYLYAGKTMTEQARSVFDSYFKSSSDNLAHDLNYILEMFRMIGSNPPIRRALDSPEYNSRLPHQLDSLVVNSTLHAQGVTLYRSGGPTYTTSLTSNPPSLEQLKSLPAFAAWIVSPIEDPLWFWRDAAEVREFYNGKYGGDGVMTMALKLNHSSANVSAYVVVDFVPADLFRFFETKNALLHGAGVGIMDGSGQVLASSRNLPLQETGAFFTADYPIENSGLVLTARLSESAVRKPLADLQRFLLAVTGFFLLFSVAAGLLAKRLIVAPLSRLYLRMKGFKSFHP
ncbi:cache domain-containing protein [Paenibacillus sp. GCM10027626]|uniref:cache domain-containing protein n=1 Tax=Paenibacillus sp. GCM10027626 TaxID=3273411 RepID=UPI0036402031